MSAHSLPLSTDELQRLADDIRNWALDLGFADAGISRLTLEQDQAHLRRWLADGFHAGMQFMQRAPDMRSTPKLLRPGTLSVISVRLNYRPRATDAWQVLEDADKGYISRYALGRDYHRLMRRRLLKLGERIETAIGPHGYRVLTDSAPALEKALARNANLGWIGKHTLLLNREAGSWFFLGEIYTDLALPVHPGPAVAESCGRCSACIGICPTKAIVAPYRLDARRCISYLTIEHYGPIPEELRPLIGNRIFGCDDCQLVCPWNRYAQDTVEPDFAPRHQLDAPQLIELFSWNESQWLQRSEGMALRRLGYNRWLRNVALAMGNGSASLEVIAALKSREQYPDETVREQIAWSLNRLQP